MKETQERQVRSLGREDPLRAWQPTPGDLPDPGIEPMSLISPASAGGFFTTSATWEGLTLWRGQNLAELRLFFKFYRLMSVW